MSRDFFLLFGIAGATLILASIIILNKVNSNEYIYIARGVQCKEYDKENNVLSKCDDATFGEVDIINPISILKIKIN
jgi:hypothetical protein